MDKRDTRTSKATGMATSVHRDWEAVIEIGNIDTPFIDVRHADLKRTGDSPYRSVCPACGVGMLMMRRSEDDGLILSEYDRCLLCGQGFRYTDLKEIKLV